MKNQKEVWLPVKGYEFIYEVSNLGNVKSLKYNKERILKLCINTTGYNTVCLSENGKTKTFKVHQLVAITFLNHKPNGHTIIVDHISNDKLNNKLSNLQLISQRENTSKDKKGSSKYTGVCWHKTINKWTASININGKQRYLGSFINEIEASNAYQNKLKTI